MKLARFHCYRRPAPGLRNVPSVSWVSTAMALAALTALAPVPVLAATAAPPALSALSTLSTGTESALAPAIAGPMLTPGAFYLFRSYEPGRDGTVTAIAVYHPLQEPGAPAASDPRARYDLHLDVDGDGVEDLTFRFRLASGPETGSEGPLGGYRAELLYGPVEHALRAGPLRPSATGATEIPGCGRGRLFAGPRRDPVSINRRLIRGPADALDPLGPTDAALGADHGFNTTAFAVELPLACLGGGDHVVAGWTSSRLPARGAAGGGLVEIARLGNPRLPGSADAPSWSSVADPAMPTHLAAAAALTSAPFELPAAVPREDLIALYLEGLPGLNATAPGADVLRLDPTVPPRTPAHQDPLGVLAGDRAGWPNGRRPGDDVVDAALRALAGGLCYLDGFDLCRPADAPAGALPWTDQVAISGSDFAPAFPYLLPPIPAPLGAITAAALSPGVTEQSCACLSYPYICWYYAMKSAGYTPSNTCPNTIDGGHFGQLGTSYMPSADIIDFGGHAGHIKSSTSSSVTVEDFNYNASCDYRPSVVYYASSWGGAVRAWVRKPAHVGLSSPANGATGVVSPVTLSWGAAAWADQYVLDVATNSSFTNPTTYYVTGTSKTLTLSGGTTYWWRVNARRGPYGSTWIYSEVGVSNARSFTVAPPCSSVAVPTISGTIYQGHPKLFWSGVSGADRYKIYIRYDTPSGSYWYYAQTTATQYVDYGHNIYAGGGTKQYVIYKVTAVNDGPGCSPAFESGLSNYVQSTCEAEIPIQ